MEKIIEERFSIKKASNSKFKAKEVLDRIIDCCIVGDSRFLHMEELRHDEGYKAIKGIKEFPGEKCFRNFFSAFDNDGMHIKELGTISDEVVRLRSQTKCPMEVWLDYDDTVIELFGDQEEGKVGDNPRYRGRPSLKARVCFVSETEDWVDTDLSSGDTVLRNGFIEFHRRCLERLPRNYVVKGVRVDSAIFDEKVFEDFEDGCIEYMVKAKKTKSLKREIKFIPDEYWENADKIGRYSIADIEFALDSWKHQRRFIIIREEMEESGQRLLPGTYKYQVIVTNNLEYTGLEVWHNYNKRARVEGRIDEIKSGFAMKEASQHEMKRNRAFVRVKQIAYNLCNWWRNAVLPDDKKQNRIETIRREIINVPGNVLGKGRSRRISLSPNRILQWIIGVIKENLDKFLYIVANGFKPPGWDPRAGP